MTEISSLELLNYLFEDLLRERFILEKILTVTSNHRLHESYPSFMEIY